MHVPSPLLLVFLLSLLSSPGSLAQTEGSAVPESESVPAVTVPYFGNATCPIMGKTASASLFVETSKGRIYVCCAPCIKTIREDVDFAYEAAYPTTTAAGNRTCPITDLEIDEKSPTVQLQGTEIGVCCPECARTASGKAQIVLARAKDSRTRDVGNETCPVTGEPADGSTIVLIGNDIVRLHSLACGEVVKLSPLKVLGEARKIAERDAKATPKIIERSQPSNDGGSLRHE